MQGRVTGRRVVTAICAAALLAPLPAAADDPDSAPTEPAAVEEQAEPEVIQIEDGEPEGPEGTRITARRPARFESMVPGPSAPAAAMAPEQESKRDPFPSLRFALGPVWSAGLDWRTARTHAELQLGMLDRCYRQDPEADPAAVELWLDGDGAVVEVRLGRETVRAERWGCVRAQLYRFRFPGLAHRSTGQVRFKLLLRPAEE